MISGWASNGLVWHELKWHYLNWGVPVTIWPVRDCSLLREILPVVVFWKHILPFVSASHHLVAAIRSKALIMDLVKARHEVSKQT